MKKQKAYIYIAPISQIKNSNKKSDVVVVVFFCTKLKTKYLQICYKPQDYIFLCNIILYYYFSTIEEKHN